jgi:hypothetical protein
MHTCTLSLRPARRAPLGFKIAHLIKGTTRGIGSGTASSAAQLMVAETPARDWP